jgi:hypothetical protein
MSVVSLLAIKPMSQMGQKLKRSRRAYVFRFALDEPTSAARLATSVKCQDSTHANCALLDQLVDAGEHALIGQPRFPKTLNQ